MRTMGCLIALAVTLGVAAHPAPAHAQRNESKARTVTLNVPDMFCGGCEVAVKMAAKKIDGVQAIVTNSDKRTAQVKYDASKTTPEAIAAAITNGSGFKTETPKSTQK